MSAKKKATAKKTAAKKAVSKMSLSARPSGATQAKVKALAAKVERDSVEQRRYNLLVDVDLLKKAKIKAMQDDKHLSDVMRELLIDWVEQSN